ncbi:alpha-N-acetylneuraminide alpha-2,8-sialyltransferase isoform X2 [Manis pentadactyla]|uniref:alpha-N-acetylneuraminide alpha-2,8-sialyltransferase isoform X2 n=1 Tax=Manis pentadactyla TaxID=143292 RepID=UPI0018744807|nr:alpha-N-acetylneuraminide alpha-2,8-sialyltransferase isoform X2 [Manis pentadactyla]
MNACGRARRHTSRGAMAVLAWTLPRIRLPVGASALCVVVLCWLYIFPVYRLPNEKEIVQGVLQQGTAWRRNQTAARVFRKQMEDCCDPAHLFAMTKMNSPMGKSMWYDGELLYSFTIDNTTYSLFPQATPFQLPLKKCAVVGNGGILKKSGCGRQIDEANFVMRCNLPPLSREYTKDVGSKSHLVTANPSIIRQRFQNLLWSRKTFVDNMKIYNHSYIYMPAFSMKTGTEPSLRVYYTLSDVGANQTVLFANPNFLRSIGKFWKSRGIHAKRLSTGLFLVSAALGLCEEVSIYGFWPFSVNMHDQPLSHHYYDNVLPFSGFHAMPEEFLQLWYLHKIGALRMQLDPCEGTSLQPTS